VITEIFAPCVEEAVVDQSKAVLAHILSLLYQRNVNEITTIFLISLFLIPTIKLQILYKDVWRYKYFLQYEKRMKDTTPNNIKRKWF